MIKRTFNLDELFIIDTGFYGWCLDVIGEMIPSVLTNNSLQDNFKNYMLKPLWRKYQFVNANYSDTENGQQQFKNDFANQLQDVCVEFYTYVKANVKHFEGLDNKTDLIKQVSSVVAPINDIINQTATDTALASGTTAQNIGTTLYNDSVWLSMFNTYMTPQRKGEMLNRFAWLFIVAYYVSEDENADEFTLEITEPLEMPTGNQVIEFDVDEGLRYAVVTIEKPFSFSSRNIKSGVNIGGVLGSYEGPDVSDATASSDDILLGKVAYGVDYRRLVGTIPTYDYEGGDDISGIVPVGAINITENGEFDVTNYAQANVNIEAYNIQDFINLINDYVSLFQGNINIENYDFLDGCDFTRKNNYEAMFYGNSDLRKAPNIKTSTLEYGVNFARCFYDCALLEEVPNYYMNCYSITGLGLLFRNCSSLKRIYCYGMNVDLDISASTQFEVNDLVTILSNCRVVSSSRTLTMGTTNIAKLNNVYVKETGIEPYENLTLRPCVICESTDEGAMLAIDYFNGKGWTLA